jgi:rRNA biogenesis protein RRP5
MSKAAQLELKYGDLERGKTMYEKLLKTCPKRIDIWSVYIDALVKQGHVDSAR